MKEKVQVLINKFVDAYTRREGVGQRWGAALLGYADACHPDMAALRRVVHPNHRLPWEVLPSATVVLVYFLPIQSDIARSNIGEGLASPRWAQTYELTNALFEELNAVLIREIAQWGYKAVLPAEATAFNPAILKGQWSQRHLARLAGLGSFGLNNMLITRRGCCGRISSLVTDLPVSPDAPETGEACLYKRDGSCAVCAVCVRRCPSGALTKTAYDRFRCYQVCRQNASVYTQFGNSYAATPGGAIQNSGSEVCGKCVVGLPCTSRRP